MKILNCISLAMLFVFHSACVAQQKKGSPQPEAIEPLPVSNGDFTVDYIMGKFDPATHPDFIEIPAEFADKAGRLLRRDAYKSFTAMREEATKDGVVLKIISATRNFESQKSIWENKWNGNTILEGGVNATTIKDPSERALKILLYSSMPGTSRHHWGTDIDLNSLNNSYFKKGKGKREYAWLIKNAHKYGYCQTYSELGKERLTGYQEEKWHWSYTPVSSHLTSLAQSALKDQMIKGFLGSETAIEIEVVEKYILGINKACL